MVTGVQTCSLDLGEEVLLLGPKCARIQVAEAAAALMNWAATEFGARDVTPGQLIIDPSDHGRPVVGASAIPGGAVCPTPAI